jgi:HSP20 family molecular chaperone IbpA
MNMRFLSILILLFPLFLFAADKPKENSQKKLSPMELRLEMHRRMMEKLLHGTGPDEGLFEDLEKMMQESFSDAFKSFQDLDREAFQPKGLAPVKTNWTESKEGRTLRIDPQDPDINLDIKVDETQIHIKGEKKKKGGKRIAFSEFSYSLSTPSDVNAAEVKITQSDSGLLLFLPFKKTDEKGRSPVQKRPGEVTI